MSVNGFVVDGCSKRMIVGTYGCLGLKENTEVHLKDATIQVHTAVMLDLCTRYPQIVAEVENPLYIRREISTKKSVTLNLFRVQFQILCNFDSRKTSPVLCPSICDGMTDDELKFPLLFDDIAALFSLIGERKPKFNQIRWCDLWFDNLDDAEDCITTYDLASNPDEDKDFSEYPISVQYAHVVSNAEDLFGNRESADTALRRIKEIAQERKRLEDELRKLLQLQCHDLVVASNPLYHEASIAREKEQLVAQENAIILSMKPQEVVSYFLTNSIDPYEFPLWSWIQVYMDFHSFHIKEVFTGQDLRKYDLQFLKALMFDGFLLHYGFKYDIDLNDFVHESEMELEERHGLFYFLFTQEVFEMETLERSVREFLTQLLPAEQLPQMFTEAYPETRSSEMRPSFSRKVKRCLELNRMEIHYFERYVLYKNRLQNMRDFTGFVYIGVVNARHSFEATISIPYMPPGQWNYQVRAVLDLSNDDLLVGGRTHFKVVLSDLQRLLNETPPPNIELSNQRIQDARAILRKYHII